MNSSVSVLLCFILSVSACLGARLHVHEGARWLVDERGRPVFLLADTGWAMTLRLKKPDLVEYLKHRKKQGFNAIAFIAVNPDGKTNAYGSAPFLLRDGRMDPARPLTVNGYDYWDHIDFAVEQLRKRGMYAILLPAWGNAVAGDYNGKVNEQIVLNKNNAYVYGNWLGQRYKRAANVIWMLGGDRSAVYGDKDYRPVFRALAEGIADGVHGASAFDGKADYAGLLMSYHPRKAHPQSSAWFHEDEWLSFHGIQQWPEDQVRSVLHDWHLPSPKPTWLFEGRYEAYWRSKYRPEQWGEWQVRYQAWQTVLSGAFGHTYGHERVFGFGREEVAAGAEGWDWKRELDAPGARSMTHLAKLMNGLSEEDLLTRMPDQSLIDGNEGKAERLTSDRITAMRSANGRLALFYSASGRTVRVRMDRLAPGTMRSWWFNPRTGMWHVDGVETRKQQPFAGNIRSGPGAPVREFVPPGAGEGNDWVLVIRLR